jgi:hypothetical protein
MVACLPLKIEEVFSTALPYITLKKSSVLMVYSQPHCARLVSRKANLNPFLDEATHQVVSSCE